MVISVYFHGIFGDLVLGFQHQVLCALWFISCYLCDFDFWALCLCSFCSCFSSANFPFFFSKRKVFPEDFVIKLVHVYGLFYLIIFRCLNSWSVAQKGLREENFVQQLDTVSSTNSCWGVVGISRVMMLWITVLSELLHLGGGSSSISHSWSTSSSIMVCIWWCEIFICSREIEWSISLLCCKKKKKNLKSSNCSSQGFLWWGRNECWRWNFSVVPHEFNGNCALLASQELTLSI